ncbi:hypothetical protein INS49_004824 [Diaporthe citri]|uniref:uncharacterized protein n=1 Tax=Diaporthe citri TaxID=83186 RepID=UPI001C7EA5DB|nr:uncharacterized protein INS49_004824 [Diaporthe citri]KAG6354220.1 hypothetical protein INS49_004824 [Diaporthe citri]
MTASKKIPCPWTPEEDILLNCLTSEKQELEEGPINWMEIALHFTNRSNKDCRKRWVYALCPSIKKGTWEEGEDSALRDAVRLFGTKWSDVSRHVGSRQADQCARRWHQILKPDINRGRWSLYEVDEMLKNAVLAHGRHWTEIVERYFCDRTPIAARSRYDLPTQPIH